MRPISRIVVHHTATSRDCTRAQIWRMHTDSPPAGRGWTDIGYHRLVWDDGHDEEGRPEAVIGAHTKGYNSDSLGIALVGNFVDANPSPDQWARAVEIVTGWCRLHGLSVDSVCGHGELTSTACPGFSADSFRFSVALALAKPPS